MRGVLIAALIAGGSYCVAAWLGWHGPTITIWKGAGVGLLAAWAALRSVSRDGWLLALVLLCGAVGDVLLDAVGMTAGAIAFLTGHVLVIILYRRHRRSALTTSERLLASLVVPCAIVAAWAMTGAIGVAIYTAILGVMAATAWTSGFPRCRVGIGAMMFVASDLLIFSRSGPLAGSLIPTLLVWPLYFVGQALIATGVTAALASGGERPISGP